MPGTTICPIPMTWSLMAFSQVMPFFFANYLGLGAALMGNPGHGQAVGSTVSG
jgi:hypothetical protein